MKRLLFLAYHFPPVGGAGVQRSLKFVRYLRDFGYDPVVVTGSGLNGGRWTPADGSLAEELPARLEVRRLWDSEPASSTGGKARIERWLRSPPPFAQWWVEGAVETGRRYGSDADVVYATMSPFESAFAAARLAHELGKPWVADLRDPWALDEMQSYPTRIHRRLEQARMGRALRTAAAIVMNTPEAVDRLERRFPHVRGKQVVAIPNGFDLADFEGEPAARTDSAFRIVHAGYLHTDLGRADGHGRRLLGGAVAGVNMMARSHVYLVEAITRLCQKQPTLARRVELHLAGVLSAADRARMPPGLVHAHGYLSHGGAIALMRSADLLFLPMHDLPSGRRAGIVPAKTYEYLATGRPILAAVPDGDARDLLARAPQAFLCRPTDVSAMEAFLSKQLGARCAQASPRMPQVPAFLQRYERRQLTADLAALLDELDTRGVRERREA